jgi:HAD superfamily hydrolase (TIGR01490 family)
MNNIAALFDMDKTLLDTSSGLLYVRYLYRVGRVRKRDLARVMSWMVMDRLGRLDMAGLLSRLLATAQMTSEPEMRQLCDMWFAEDVVSHVTERGRQRLAEHAAQGHVLGIVSASTQYVVGPMAAFLDIPGQYVCTHLESENGLLTGKIIPPFCYGEGKIVWAERFAAEYDVDLRASYFYTDSISDLPLLERVGHPVAVNPDLRLRRLALARNWPVIKFY